jgi:hypothetical protein
LDCLRGNAEEGWVGVGVAKTWGDAMAQGTHVGPFALESAIRLDVRMFIMMYMIKGIAPNRRTWLVFTLLRFWLLAIMVHLRA